MKLYHASKYKFEKIERQQASHPEAEAFEVPESELQNKIYLTPDIGFAIAMASGPDGMTSLIDGKVSFEHYEQFDENRPVYVYKVDTGTIAPELLEKVDDEQFAVDMNEITPDEIREFVAKDVFKFYQLEKWKHPGVRKSE